MESNKISSARSLDSKKSSVNQYFCKWLGRPISRNVKYLRFKVKELGIGLKLTSDIYRLNQITV